MGSTKCNYLIYNLLSQIFACELSVFGRLHILFYISYNRIQVLKKVLSTPSISSQFSSEELQVANTFLRDFEKSGIHLPSSDREQFVHLSDKIIAVGRQFTQILSQRCNKYIDVDVSLLDGLNLGINRGTKKNIVSLSTRAWETQMVLKFVKDERVRKEMYIAANSATEEQISLLEDLLKTRAELAKLVGMESYSHIFLIDKMVKDPGMKISTV